jgi:hypothetical protein
VEKNKNFVIKLTLDGLGGKVERAAMYCVTTKEKKTKKDI